VWIPARALVLVVLAAGCAASGPPANETDPAGPAELRRTVDELRREVAELRARLGAERIRAVSQQQLLILRQELQAVQRALEALVRDVDQRHLEAVQTLERRVAAVSRRLDDLAAAPGAEPPPAAAPPAPPATAAPVPPAESLREPAGSAARLTTIRRVHASAAGGETRVSVEADGPLQPRAFALADPPRLVLDFENAAFGFARTPAVVDGTAVERIRFIQLRATPVPVVRLFLTLRGPASHWIESQPRGLVLHLGSDGPRR